MKDLITALIELLRTTIGPFLSGYLIADTANKAKLNEKKANELEARVAAQNQVAAMSPTDVQRVLRDEWTTERKLRRPKTDTH